MGSPPVELLSQNVDNTIAANVTGVVSLAVFTEILIMLFAEKSTIFFVVVPATVLLGNLSF